MSAELVWQKYTEMELNGSTSTTQNTGIPVDGSSKWAKWHLFWLVRGSGDDGRDEARE